MKTQRLIIFGAAGVAAAVVVFTVAAGHWRWRQPEFREGPKLVAAIHAFSQHCAAEGQAPPATVTLKRLVSEGYLAAADVRAFDGMDVTISVTADDTSPQEVLMRVRLPDGSGTAVMGDGSVRQLPR